MEKQPITRTDENFQCTIEPKPIPVYFVYRGQEPEIEKEIDLRELIKNVDYFYDNRNNFSEGSRIELLTEDQLPILDENIITTFISFCSHKTIQITNDNVIQLRLLSKQFNIASLLTKTEEYINKYKSELIFPELLSNQNEFNDAIEESIANDLFQYIDNDNFYRLSVSILFRILKRYNDTLNDNENLTDSTKKQKIETFLFKCLVYHESKASCLFDIFDFLFNDDQILLKILQKTEIIDLDMISSIKFVKPLIKLLTQSNRIQPEKALQIDLNLEKQNEDKKILIIKEGTTKINESEYKGNECETVIIPKSVTEIGKCAFAHCKYLKKVIINSNLEIIDESAFFSCHNLKSINLPNSLKEIRYTAFRGCTKLIIDGLPNSLNKIANYCFCSCSSITKIKIPNSVTEIGDYAFHLCTSLTEVEIPNSVTEIGIYAFHSCTSLTKIKIPKSVVSIKTHTFWNCTSLTKAEIPKNVVLDNYSFPDGQKFELKTY